MSITQISSNTSHHTGWVEPGDLLTAGFRPAGPEIDFGQTWGDDQSIRVSYAPFADFESGFLYAHDRRTGRSLLLAADTTEDAVEQASRLLPDYGMADGHLALAAVLNERPLTPGHAQALWTHCLEREMEARNTYVVTSDPDARFSAARDVIVNESARTAAEDLLVNAYSAAADRSPVVVRHRVPAWPGWSGRFAAGDLDESMVHARQLKDIVDSSGFAVQATSVTHGAAVLSASRVPALEFIATTAQLEHGNAPTL